MVGFPLFTGLYYYQYIVSGWFSSIYWSVLLSVHCLWLVFIYLLVCIIISTLLVVGFHLFLLVCIIISTLLVVGFHLFLLVCIIISALLVVSFPLFTGPDYYQYIVSGWFSSIYWSVLSVHCFWLVFIYLLVCIIISTLLLVGFPLFTGLYYYQYIVSGWFSSIYWSVLLSVHC